MPNARDFVVASCQATAFTPDAELSTARFTSRLLPRWVARFDAEPTILPPLPDGMPKDIPRVILESRSLVWRCEVAPARINIFWRAVRENAVNLREVYREITPILIEYSEFLGSRVGRLAAVVNRYVRHEAPARLLASHFCQDRWLVAPFNRPASFELHAHKVYMLAGRFQVNSWVRNRTGTLAAENGQVPIVLVEQDVNTLAEEAATRSITQDEIGGFFEVAGPGFDETLSLYYPPERL